MPLTLANMTDTFGDRLFKIADLDFPARTFEVLIFGNLSGSKLTFKVNGNVTVLTEGVDWNAETSNTASATNLAVAIDGITGLTATSSGATVAINIDATVSWESVVSNAAETDLQTLPDLSSDVELATAISASNSLALTTTRERYGDTFPSEPPALIQALADIAIWFWMQGSHREKFLEGDLESFQAGTKYLNDVASGKQNLDEIPTSDADVRRQARRSKLGSSITDANTSQTSKKRGGKLLDCMLPSD